MLHFLHFLEFILGLIVFALGLALGLDKSSFGWLTAIILILVAGIWSVLVVVMSHFAFGGFVRPILMVGLLHVAAFGFDLAAFIVALTYPPYSTGCDDSTFKWCEIEKAAIGLIGALWIFFLISSFILCVDAGAYTYRGGRTPGAYPRYYY